MFHPNIYQDGSICLDILSDKWSPTFDIMLTLHSIQSLLDDPNPHSPANSLAADLFMQNKSEYIRRVALSVEKSWNDEVDDDNDSLYEESETDFVPAFEDVQIDPMIEDLAWSQRYYRRCAEWDLRNHRAQNSQNLAALFSFVFIFTTIFLLGP